MAAEKTTERSKQKQSAEAERSDAQKKLAALRRDIEHNEAVKTHAADALNSSEAAISGANRSLRELAQEQRQTEALLAQLKAEYDSLLFIVERQQMQIATLLRDQHVAGAEDRIKLLLSGDNPNRINRELQYMGYVSQAQTKLLAELRANLVAVEANQSKAQNARNELDEIAAEAKAQKALLENEKRRRATMLTQISGKLASQRKEAGNIERDEQRLGGLVEKLAKLIEEQRKADVLEKEKQDRQRKALAARKPKEAEKRIVAKDDAKPGRSQTAMTEDEPAPAKSLAKNELTPQNDVQDTMFASMRGRLRLPLKGELIAKYGSKRGDGPVWKGLFIRASEGSDVKAVAAGKVVFAEWLRGFGNLIIVDHGNQYMTIYGNNQAVLKHAGDVVKTGDLIASAGNSGGNEQSGLYFEMRHQGRAFDPLDWVTLK
jgi:septal ring factor EnvC (AmiA/AmiB activator)